MSTCIKCGYELAGIAAEGSCPECGVSVEFSREAMDIMSPRRRKDVGRGAVGIAGSFVLIATAAIVLLSTRGMLIFGSAIPLDPASWSLNAIGWLLILSEILILPSYLKLGAREAVRSTREGQFRWRMPLVVAIYIQAAVIGCLIVLGALYIAEGQAQWRAWIGRSAVALYLLAVPARVVFSILLSGEIAERLRELKTAQLARTLVWQVPLAFGIGVVSALGILVAALLQIWLFWRIRKLVRRISPEGV